MPRPGRARVPLMVPREMVGGAIGLNSVAFNAPSVAGPPLAGLLIAGIGVAPCFLVNALTTLAVVIALVFMKPAPPSSTRRGDVFGAILEGVRFLIDHPVLRWVVLLLLVTAVTIRPYNFLLPAYAVHVIHTDAKGLGWLMAATGLGAIGGAFLTAATGADRRGPIWIRRRSWAPSVSQRSGSRRISGWPRSFWWWSAWRR